MQYTALTVSVTNGSPVVTGAAGTKFLSNVTIGNTFKIKGVNTIYQIGAVSSDTQITLSSNYVDTTASGLQYQITRDFTPNLGLAEITTGDMDWPYHLTQEVIRKLDTEVAARAKLVAVPSTATSAGVAGQFAYNTTHLYVCVATNTWRRVALSTW